MSLIIPGVSAAPAEKEQRTAHTRSQSQPSVSNVQPVLSSGGFKNPPTKVQPGQSSVGPKDPEPKVQPEPSVCQTHPKFELNVWCDHDSCKKFCCYHCICNAHSGHTFYPLEVMKTMLESNIESQEKKIKGISEDCDSAKKEVDLHFEKIISIIESHRQELKNNIEKRRSASTSEVNDLKAVNHSLDELVNHPTREGLPKEQVCLSLSFSVECSFQFLNSSFILSSFFFEIGGR